MSNTHFFSYFLKHLQIGLFVSCILSVGFLFPYQADASLVETMKKKGEASWFVPGGKRVVAAHRKLPIGTIVTVTNRANGKKVDVTIVDRGPFIQGRIIDLSKYAFNHIARDTQGVIKVKIRVKTLP